MTIVTLTKNLVSMKMASHKTASHKMTSHQMRWQASPVQRPPSDSWALCFLLHLLTLDMPSMTMPMASQFTLTLKATRGVPKGLKGPLLTP